VLKLLDLFPKFLQSLLANVLAVLAFKNTSVLSALVLSSWTIPCIMLLSTYFLQAHYSRLHVQCAFVCLIGLALLIWGDTIGNDESTGKKKKKKKKKRDFNFIGSQS
jgi:solute carrier family 35 protein F1/2